MMTEEEKATEEQQCRERHEYFAAIFEAVRRTRWSDAAVSLQESVAMWKKLKAMPPLKGEDKA